MGDSESDQQGASSTGQSSNDNRPDMTDWDKPAGSESLRESELRKSFSLEKEEDK
jgi:hypothetical protein